jgi:hypothetical protein
VALDAVVVHVHASNRLESLDLVQLAGVFAGRIRNWRELGGPDAPIVAYGRENSSGTYDFFKETVLKRADFAGSVQMLQGTAQVLSAVAQDPNGIGYGSGAISGGTRRLRLAPGPGAESVAADEHTVRSGSYPLSRSLYFYLDPAADVGRIHAWIEWVRGDAGQGIVGGIDRREHDLDRPRIVLGEEGLQVRIQIFLGPLEGFEERDRREDSVVSGRPTPHVPDRRHDAEAEHAVRGDGTAHEDPGQRMHRSRTSVPCGERGLRTAERSVPPILEAADDDHATNARRTVSRRGRLRQISAAGPVRQ